MRRSLHFVALAFLVGCNRVPTESTRTSATPGAAPVAVDTPAAPADTGMSPPSPDMGPTASDLGPSTDGGPSLCANQIDPGTHQPIVLRAVDDHDLFYVAPYQPSAVMAVAKDGSSAPRTLAPITGYAGGATAFDVTIDDSFVYYLDDGVWRVPKAGGAPVELAAPQSGSCGGPYVPQRIAVDSTRVWGTASGGCTGDYELRPLYFGFDKSVGGSVFGSPCIGLVVAADDVARCRAPGNGIVCNGADNTTWAADVGGGVTALALDGGQLFVGTVRGVYTVAKGDTVATLIVPSATKVTSVVARDGLLWYASDHIYRVDPKARLVTQLDPRPAADLVVDEAFVYFQTVCNVARIAR